jgi:hypothetical protein
MTTELFAVMFTAILNDPKKLSDASIPYDQLAVMLGISEFVTDALRGEIAIRERAMKKPVLRSVK